MALPPDYNPIGAYSGMFIGAVLTPLTLIAAWTLLVPSDGQAGMAICMLSPLLVVGGGFAGFLFGSVLDQLRDCRKQPDPPWWLSNTTIALIGVGGVLFLVTLVCSGAVALVLLR